MVYPAAKVAGFLKRNKMEERQIIELRELIGSVIRNSELLQDSFKLIGLDLIRVEKIDDVARQIDEILKGIKAEQDEIR